MIDYACFETVSYTHLDVYKRQGFAFALKYLRDCGVSADDLRHAFVMDNAEYQSYVNRKFTDADRLVSAKYPQDEIE